MLSNLNSLEKEISFSNRPLALQTPPRVLNLAGISHPFDDATFSKSTDLFESRRLLAVARRHLNKELFRQWFSQAITIQMAIYQLDFHYERSVAIQSADVTPLWCAISDRLLRAAGQASEMLWSGFADLRRYALTETRIHQFDPIDPREFEGIVRLKCADVRIARSLLWSLAALSMSSPLVLYWELFDECWEFIEDLRDIAEDGRDWNFNFWLYSFMAGGDPGRGTTCATAALLRGLDKLETAYSHLPAEHRDSVRESLMDTVAATKWVIANSSSALLASSCDHVIRFRDQAERAELQRPRLTMTEAVANRWVPVRQVFTGR